MKQFLAFVRKEFYHVLRDRRTLLILTSGFNRNSGPDAKRVPALSNEYVFVYDVAGKAPVKRQVLQVPNTFLGLAWAPSGKRFYVSAGVDDAVLEYAAGAQGYEAARTFPLGHAAGLGIDVKASAAGLAVSPDGRWLLAANLQNESVSLVDLESGKVAREQRHLERARHVEHVNLIGRDDLDETFERLVDDVGMPGSFDECITGECHSDLLSRQTRHPRRSRPHPAPETRKASTFSFIRTLTVGSGIPPDLLTPPRGRRSRARGQGRIPPVGNFAPP